MVPQGLRSRPNTTDWAEQPFPSKSNCQIRVFPVWFPDIPFFASTMNVYRIIGRSPNEWQRNFIHRNLCVVDNPDSKVHVANMGPTWVLSVPGVRNAFTRPETQENCLILDRKNDLAWIIGTDLRHFHKLLCKILFCNILNVNINPNVSEFIFSRSLKAAICNSLP